MSTVSPQPRAWLTLLSPENSAYEAKENQASDGSVYVGFRISGILAHFISVARNHTGPGRTYVGQGQYPQTDWGLILVHKLKSHLKERKV